MGAVSRRARGAGRLEDMSATRGGAVSRRARGAGWLEDMSAMRGRGG